MTYNGEQGSMGWGSRDDTQASAITDAYCLIVKDQDNATIQEAIFVSMDADGFTINFSSSTATADVVFWKAVR